MSGDPNTILTFEQWPGESAQAYQAASAYFAMGADRSLDAVHQKYTKSTRLIARWSVRWRWVERAEAYDRHLAELEREKREQAVSAEAEKWAQRRAEQRENDWALAQGLAVAAAQILQVLDPKQAKAADAAKLAETAAKLARLAADMITDHQQLDIEPVDWDQVPEDVEAAFADGRIALRDVLRHIQRTRRT